MATPHFSISYGSSAKAAGIGVIVPKKVARSSIERHLLKRRIREILRELLKDGEMAGTVIIVSARAGAASLSFQKLKEELSGAFKAILLETKS